MNNYDQLKSNMKLQKDLLVVEGHPNQQKF